MLKISNLVPAPNLAKYNLKDGYSIVPLVTSGWKNHSGRKVCIIIESVDRYDLKNQSLLSSSKDMRGLESNIMRSLLPNLINNSIEYVSRYGVDVANEAYALVNFGATKYFDRQGTVRANLEYDCKNRVLAILKELQPTDVIIFGDAAAEHLVDTPRVMLKRGWVHKGSIAAKLHAKRVVNTIDLETLYNRKSSGEDDDETTSDKFAAADLLFYLSRNVANLWAGKMLHSAASVVPNPKLVDTVSKFDKLLAILEANKVIAVDLETATLESKANQIYTSQFSVRPEVGYVLPVEHPNTPFDTKEVEYIKSKLAEFFGRSKGLKTLVGANFKFDMRVLRAQLGIDFIHHRIWDVQAGEILLDENVSWLGESWRGKNGVTQKTSVQNLRNMCVAYGNELYYELPFSKEERATLHRVDITTNKDAQDYCALDVQLPILLYQLQIERSHYLPYPKDFSSTYYTHIIRQMSPTCVVLSHMEAYGSNVDKEYLMSLVNKETSPLLQSMKEAEDELAKSANFAEANKQLAAEAGLCASGLFGTVTNVFKLTKPLHRLKLFVEVMGLKPIHLTKTGQPQLDKHFLAKYAEKHKEAQLALDWNIAQKLMSTFVKGWIKKLADSIDSAVDNHLRPSFDFWRVVTGRLNSSNPNLQQVPSRGSAAKRIKRQFVAPKGMLQLRYDYSAHEVRMWGNAAEDANVAESFLAGQRLRKKLIAATEKGTIEKILETLKKKGDVHIQNVYRFLGEWVDKEHPYRHAIKGIVFG